MLTKYQFTLLPDRTSNPPPEWGYRLYAALLESAPPEFGAMVHQDGATPISQFLSCSPDGVVWTVNLLGSQCESVMKPVLENCHQFSLGREPVRWDVTAVKTEVIEDVDRLFERSRQFRGVHRLHFCTSTAFKSQGEYLSLPTTRLIVQNLIKNWNGCITECPIEDEDGEGLEILASRLRMTAFQLQNRSYRLKKQNIPGFVGSMTLEHSMRGFHGELADALLLFADFAGIGIKTTLGMGGVMHR